MPCAATVLSPGPTAVYQHIAPCGRWKGMPRTSLRTRDVGCAGAPWPPNATDSVAADTAQWPPTDSAIAGAIQATNLSMWYAKGQELVLHDLNFSIASGEKVGIIGRTGAGKSSLLGAILRMAPTAGSLTVAGRETSALPLPRLRRFINVIPQEPMLFNGTVRRTPPAPHMRAHAHAHMRTHTHRYTQELTDAQRCIHAPWYARMPPSALIWACPSMRCHALCAAGVCCRLWADAIAALRRSAATWIPLARAPTPTSGRPSSACSCAARWSSWTAGWRPWSRSLAPTSASASGSCCAWRARSCGRRAFWCWTRRRPTWTRTPTS
eukprot:m.991679 g.991679  ORF g.991679 m.991679 type:complete len:324 (-) comp24003_c0_seq67:816-1787(-)